MALPDIDLHLLRCLDVLVTERHVTRAADKMGMTQSGMSTVLARLRTVFDDPILVRTSHGMQHSEHALEIAGAVRRALNEIDLAVARRGAFVPATSSVMFSVMASDHVGLMLLPRLIERLQVEAPNVVIKVIPPAPNRIREALANSEADLVIGFFLDVADNLFQTVVMQETLACVARQGHPRIDGSLSIADYASELHVYYGTPPAMVSSLEAWLEGVLPPLGIERRIALYLPSLAIVPRIISQSNLLSTFPAHLATTFAGRLALQVLPLPFEVPLLPVRTIWHERMHENNAHKWLRALIQEIGHSPC